MATLTLDPPVRAEPTEAERVAARNRGANLAALAARQPRLAGALATSAPDLTWIFARDGSLTGFEPGGGERWYAGCSVPLLAARAMLKSLAVSAGAACFLDPSHAAEVRVVLEMLQPEQALICVIPYERTLNTFLHCDDFSPALSDGRLWFACGPQWADEFGALLRDVPGLPTPSRFIRLPHADASAIERLVADAQRVFSEHTARLSATVTEVRERWRPSGTTPAKALCVVARSRFRLWDDAGHALHAALAGSSADEPQGFTCRRFDPDDPAGCSPLALATAAAACDAVVAADIGRADVPQLAPRQMPWVTWVTTPRVPVFPAAGPNDRLLLAEPSWRDAALAAGWPADRVGLAGWSALVAPQAQDVPDNAALVLIADTCALDAPESLAEFSSHCLLWEKVRRAVLRDPFAVPTDVAGWVCELARAEGIADETLDVRLFVARLVVPAYQHALADALLAAGVPLKLYGRGWADLPRFASSAAGELTSREHLAEIARDATALVHAWPTAGAHPVDALGRPVVRRTGRRKETFLRDAGWGMKGLLASQKPEPSLSTALLARILHATSSQS